MGKIFEYDPKNVWDNKKKGLWLWFTGTVLFSGKMVDPDPSLTLGIKDITFLQQQV